MAASGGEGTTVVDRPSDWVEPARVKVDPEPIDNIEPDPIEEQETLPLPDKFAGPRRAWVQRAALAGIMLFAVVASVLLATYPRIVAAFDPYTTGHVTQGNLLVTVTAPGVVNAPTYQVALPAAAPADALKVAIGQIVTQGQVLVQLSPADLQSAVTLAQTRVTAENNVLSAAQTALFATQTAASSTLQAASLNEQNAIQNVCPHDAHQDTCVAAAQATYAAVQDQTQQQLAEAQSQVTQAQAQVSTAQAAAQSAQSALQSGSTIVAPHAGTIAFVGIGASTANGVSGTGTTTFSSTGPGPTVPGASATPASGQALPTQAQTPMIVIVDLTAPQIVATVSQTVVPSIQAGQPATFTLSAYGNRIFRGTVSSISSFGQPGPHGPTFGVTITADAQSLGSVVPLPGMTGQIVIKTAQRFGVRLVPNGAVAFADRAADPHAGILTRAQAQTAQAAANQQLAALESSDPTIAQDQPRAAFILERGKDGWVTRPVVLGLTNGSVYEVLTGLKAGDVVVTGER